MKKATNKNKGWWKQMWAKMRGKRVFGQEAEKVGKLGGKLFIMKATATLL